MTFGDLWGDLGGPDTISHLPGGQKESIDTKNEKNPDFRKIRISRIRAGFPDLRPWGWNQGPKGYL